MEALLNEVDWEQMLEALQETVYMTFTSLLVAVILGFILGIILYITQEDGLYPNKTVNK